ncbi:hypothetical protein D3C78_1496830 [compost metagenome]
MTEIVAEALLASQVDELLVLGTELLEQFATRPGRVLMITRGTDRQYGQLDLGQACPPVLVGITEAPEQAKPAHAFQGQADGLVLRAALEP